MLCSSASHDEAVAEVVAEKMYEDRNREGGEGLDNGSQPRQLEP